MKRLTDNDYKDFVEIISTKIEAELGVYLPKVQGAIFDFEDFRDEELPKLKKARSELA